MKKILLILLVVLFSAGNSSFASHLMGGEITWTCIKSGPNTGRFQFKVKLYRDCNGIPGPTSITLTSNAPGNASINCNKISQTDISPQGPGCPTCAVPAGNLNAVEEFVYLSAPIFITGVPPATGWFFYYSDCCRNTGITNLSGTGSGEFTLRALMFPYNASNTNPCYDSSPQFAERPQLATCTNYPTNYNHNATDEELDSLVYSWGNPLQNGYPGTNYPYSAGYSSTNPLPGPAQNPLNTGVTMNPSTGVVGFTSFTPGVFVTVTKVTAYKCNIKVAEIYREIQIALKGNCNLPAGSINLTNAPPNVTDSLLNPLNTYIDTVVAGDTVKIKLLATDFDQLTAGTFQSLIISATGSQFGTNNSNPNAGCLAPPCATLTPADPNINPFQFNVGYTTAYFNWVTDCNHLPSNIGCVNLSSTYNFVLKVYDNFCPSPSVTFNTLTIVVVAPPPAGPARMKCLDVQDDGTTKLTFLPPVDTGEPDTNKFFKSFYIYRSVSGGPFALIDSMKGFKITNYDTVLTYLDNNVNAVSGPVSYYLTTHSGCELLPPTVSDTLSTIHLQVSQVGTNAVLNWTALSTPLPASSTNVYNIYREQPPMGSNNWVAIGTTPGNVFTYQDPVFVCDDSVRYRVSVIDTSAANCESRSNLDTVRLTSALPNITSPSLHCTAVQPNGDVLLSWVNSVDTAGYFQQWNIYHSINRNGPYTLIGTVPTYSTNTFMHVGANANNAIQYYYLTITAGCDAGSAFESITATSDSLASMLLNVSNATLGFANLSWNAIRTPLPSTASLPYRIMRRSTGVGAYVQIGTSNTLTYQDVINTCNEPYEYRVELDDNSVPCTSISSADNDIFTSLGNIIGNPILRCVDVQVNGQIRLTWENPSPSSFNDFNEYEIWRNSGAGFVLIDSVQNSALNTYDDLTANGNAQAYSYYMVTQSGCTGQLTNGTQGNTLSSIYLTVSGVPGQANMSWTALSTPLPASTIGSQYNVLNDYNLNGTLSFIGDTARLVYSHPITDCDTNIRHQVIVDDNFGCSSKSNITLNLFSWIGNVVNAPDLRCVDVLPNGSIQLTWIAPAGSNDDFNDYEIFRNSGAGFALVHSETNFNQTSWIDNTANGNTQSYSYYMRTKSGCSGLEISPTNSATLSSIFLTTSGVVGQANLSWTALATPLPASIIGGQYDIYNNYNAAGTLSLIGDTSRLVYAHPILDCDTILSHQVIAVDASGCSSRSNIPTNNFTWIGNIVNSPDLRCVDVQPNGQIILTWKSPTGSSNEFNEYEIYRNNGTGFQLLDSVGVFNQTTWTDISANGNAQSISYYMLSQSGCSGQVNSAVNSNTLNSIYITTSATPGQATINWNAHPLLPTSAPGGYDVWSSYPNGNSLSVIGSTVNQSYNEVISNCDTTLQHKVTLTDTDAGCTSNSNIDTNDFTYIGNIIGHPELRCASVSANGQVTLTWVNPTPVSWDNFNQYNIWRNTGAGYVLIDSIGSNTVISYNDLTANGNVGSVSYYLQTKSGCNGQTDPSAIGGPANGNTISTIYLTVGGANTTTANLSWNAVTNPLLGTSSGTYTIEREQPAGAGNWAIVANVNTTSWQDNLTLCIDSVNYRISISDNAPCTSISNINGGKFVDHTVPGAPFPRCASVQANGNVNISWELPVDTGMRFGSYTVYRSQNPGGPFTSVGVINSYATGTFLDNTVNAQAASYYYYLTTKTACGGEESAGSDTLQTIKVNVTNNNGVALITWNPLHSPELISASGVYRVFKEYPAGIWSQIGTTNSPVYQWTDTINVCQAIINYRVETGDNLPCTSISSIDGDLFRDVTRPIVSSLDTVSLDPLNPAQVSVSWLPSPSGDVVGYIIYQFNGASWDSIGAVSGINASYFLHNNPAAEFASQRYSITAYDSCGNISSIGSSHNTLFITAKLDVCRGAIDLRWNPYINMVNGVSQYRIYMSENGGAFSLLASVPGNNVSYSHTGLTDESTYCYFVQAVGNTNTRTASSNQACEYADLLELPTFSYLKRATVVDDRRVLVEVLVDTANNPDVSRYKLQRAFDKNGPYVTVNATPYSGQPIISIIDNGARTNLYSYYYRVITIDSCGNDVLISNLGRTILITGQPDYNLVNKVSWNFYEDWLGGVTNYTLFRSVDGVWGTTPLISVNNGILNHDDDISSLYKFPDYAGKFCYYVEAYEGAGNPYGFTDTSRSNIFCLVQEPHLFIPNGFTPDGKNTIFKPEFIYVNAKNYYFAVFNRWGMKVYETRTPGEGWDGSYNGSIAPEGIYGYTVRIYGTNGQEIEKVGTVTLLR